MCAPLPRVAQLVLAASNQFSEQMSATNGNRFAWLQDSQAGDSKAGCVPAVPRFVPTLAQNTMRAEGVTASAIT